MHLTETLATLLTVKADIYRTTPFSCLNQLRSPYFMKRVTCPQCIQLVAVMKGNAKGKYGVRGSVEVIKHTYCTIKFPPHTGQC